MQRFDLMSRENRRNWICDLCTGNKKKRTRKDNATTSTPIRVGPKSTAIMLSKAQAKPKSQNALPKVITKPKPKVVKAPVKLNVSVSDKEDNSFLSLDTDLRTSFPDASKSGYLARSLPDLSTVCTNTENEELKNEVDSLKAELCSAHTEIENLLMEKSSLEKLLCDQQKTIIQLKTICTGSPIRRNTSISSTPKMTLTSKQLKQINPISSQSNRVSVPTTTYPAPKKNSSGCVENAEVCLEDSTHQPQRHTTSPEVQHPLDISSKLNDFRPNTIWILGTQQCVGLSSELARSRDLKGFRKYSVTAITKPFASAEETLKSFCNVRFGTMDKIVICVGENDSNPLKLGSELSAFLKKHNKHTILVMKILDNKYLNVNKLNRDVELMCKNFDNCYYVNVNINNNRKNALSTTCSKLNFLINSIDYDNTFLKQSQLIKCNNRHLQSVNFNHDYTHTNKLQNLSRQTNCNRVSSQQISLKSKPRQSCIRDYFPLDVKTNVKPIQKTLLDYFEKIDHISNNGTKCFRR